MIAQLLLLTFDGHATVLEAPRLIDLFLSIGRVLRMPEQDDLLGN